MFQKISLEIEKEQKDMQLGPPRQWDDLVPRVPYHLERTLVMSTT